MSNQHYNAKLFKDLEGLDKEDVIFIYKNQMMLEKESNEAEQILSHLIYSPVMIRDLLNFVNVHCPERNKAGEPARQVLTNFLLALDKNRSYMLENLNFINHPNRYKKL